MFDIGPDKLAVIFGAALLFLGPKELPALARKIGELRRQLRTMQDTLRSELSSMTHFTLETSAPNTDTDQDTDPTAGHSFN
jgi:Sec-independent protein translocase protein TatA